MSINEKVHLDPEGACWEFLLLKIIAADKVYVADILKALKETEFATQEGHASYLPASLSKIAPGNSWWTTNGRNPKPGPPRKYYELTAKGREHLRERRTEYWQKISGTVKGLGQKVSKTDQTHPKK